MDKLLIWLMTTRVIALVSKCDMLEWSMVLGYVPTEETGSDRGKQGGEGANQGVVKLNLFDCPCLCQQDAARGSNVTDYRYGGSARNNLVAFFRWRDSSFFDQILRMAILR